MSMQQGLIWCERKAASSGVARTLTATAAACLLIRLSALALPSLAYTTLIDGLTAGLGLAVLVRAAYRCWPAVLLVLLSVSVGVDLLAGRSLVVAAGPMLASMLTVTSSAVLIRKICGDVGLTRIREVVTLSLAVVYFSAGAAVLGAAIAKFAAGAPMWQAWLDCWTANVLGTLVITPFVISWTCSPTIPRRPRWDATVEAVAFLGIWGAACWIVFRANIVWHEFPRPYMLTCLLAWGALRLRLQEVTLALLLLTGIAASVPILFEGTPPWDARTGIHRLILAELYVSFTAVMALLLSTSHAQWQRNRDAAEQNLQERAAFGRLAARLAVSLSVDDVARVVREESEILLGWDAHYFAVRHKHVGYQMLYHVDTINGHKQMFPGSNWPTATTSPRAQRVLKGEPILVNREPGSTEPVFNRAGDESRLSASIMDVPLFSGSEVIGAVSAQSYTPYRYGPDDLHLFQRLADMVAPALERAYAEARLRENEERWRALLDNMPAAVQGYGVDGTVTYWNRASEQLYGYTETEAVGKNLGNLIIPPEAQPHFAQALSIAKSIGRSGEFMPAGELSLRHKDGSPVPVYSTHTAVRGGVQTTLFCLDIDLTERRRAEEALRLANNRLSLIARVNAAVVGSAPISEQANDLARQVRTALRADACVLRILEDEELVLLGSDGLPPESARPRLGAGWGISAEVIGRRRPVFIQDILKYPVVAPIVNLLPSSYQFASYAGAPLIVGDRVIGIMGVYWETEAREFNEKDLNHLQVLSNHIAVAIVNEQLHEEVLGHRDQLAREVAERKRSEHDREVFTRLAARLAAADTVDDILQVVRDESEVLLDWDAHYFAVRHEHEGALQIVSMVDTVNGRKQTFPSRKWTAAQDSIRARRVLNGEPVLINRPEGSTEPESTRFGDETRASASIMDVPVCSGKEVVGILSAQSYTAFKYNEESLRTLQRIADMVAPALERARARTVLQESEERYRLLADNVTDVIWAMDSNLDLTYVSPAIEHLLGYRPAELESKSFACLLTPASQQEAVKIIQQALARPTSDPQDVGPVRIMMLECMRKQGDTLWVEVTGRLFRDTRLQTAGFIGIARDVTERRQVEIERETTISFLRLINEIRDTRQLIEAAVRFFHAQSGCESLGIRLREGDDYPYYECRGFPEAFRRQENSLCSRSADGQVELDESGQPVLECMCGNIIAGRFDPSMPFFTAQGSFWTNGTTDLLASTTEADRQAKTRNRCNTEGYESVALIPLCVGEQRMGVLQLNDRRKGMFSLGIIALWERLANYLAVAVAKCQAEEALRDSQARYQSLYSAVSGGVLVQDHTGVYTHINDAACEILGIDQERLRGDHTIDPEWKTVQPDGSPLSQEMYPTRVTLRTGRSVRNMVMGILAPGETRPRWVLVNCEPILDGATKRVLSAVATITDITALKQAEERNTRLAEQLRQSQKMEAIGQLAGGVAHNFNNLLLAISGYSEAIAEDLERQSRRSASRCLHAIGQLRKAVEMGTSLTQRLRAFCRKQVVHPVALDPDRAVSDMRPMLCDLLGSSISLDVQAAANGKSIRIEPGLLEECILNLVLNARDAMPNGGSLTICTSIASVDLATAELHEVEPGSYICIAATDTGIGMDADTRARLFEPFFTTKPLAQGVGLGLATVYGFIRQAGGYIEVISEPSEGSTFRLYLPQSEARPLPAVNRKTEAQATTAGQTILFCEDDEMIRGLVTRYLSSRGYQVIAAAHAEAALQKLEAQPQHIDVLLSDVQMGAMGGVELARLLKQRYPSIRCVLISGHPDYMPDEEHEPGGQILFLSKPFQFPELLTAIQQAAS